MGPKHPVDYLIMGVCLDLRLASRAQLDDMIRLQIEAPTDVTLDELLVGAGILSRPQRDEIFQALETVRSLRNTNLADSASYLSSDDFSALPTLPSIPDSSGPRDIGHAITLLEDQPTIQTDQVLPPAAFAPPPKAKYQLVQNRDIPGIPSSSSGQTPPPLPLPVPGIGSAATQVLGIPASSSMESLFPDSRLGSSAVGLSETLKFSSLVRSAGTDGSHIDMSRAKGSYLAGHRIERKLGAGGMGEVYLATQMNLNRGVAIKILPPDSGTNEKFIRRFVDEARTLATFTHPNIVQVYDVGVDDGVYWFSMESVPGHSLSDLLKQDGKIPVPLAVNMAKQMLRGLERAARAGIIHRDIKPANVLVDNQGIVKVVDFGLAVHQDDLAKLGKSVAGTPYYISPEQSRGETVTSASDQYSLGATLYHMLTGKPPFTGRAVNEVLEGHRNLPATDPCLANPEIPPTLGRIVLRMLAKRPEERFPSFQSLFRQLEDFELREGLTETRSSFLAEGLLNIGEQSVRNLQGSIAIMVGASAAFTAAAIGLSVMFDTWGLHAAKTWAGNLGAVLLLLALGAILHIAAVRKNWIPKFGSIRTWLQVHIALALLGYFLSMVHSGNFFAFILGPPSQVLPDGTVVANTVPILPFLNSILFTFVVTSGLIGRYIWRDLAKQVTAQRIAKGLPPDEANRETHELTLALFAQKGLRYWRVFHYPMAMALVVLTLAHIITILFYTGW